MELKKILKNNLVLLNGFIVMIFIDDDNGFYYVYNDKFDYKFLLASYGDINVLSFNIDFITSKCIIQILKES